MQFTHDNTTLTLTDNQITITQGNEALTVTAPIWAVEIIEADKPHIKDIDFSERSRAIIPRLLKYIEKNKPIPPTFNPVTLACPNRHALQFHDDGTIALYSPCGKRVSFAHKPLINAQIARAKGYRVTQ